MENGGGGWESNPPAGFAGSLVLKTRGVTRLHSPPLLSALRQRGSGGRRSTFVYRADRSGRTEERVPYDHCAVNAAVLEVLGKQLRYSMDFDMGPKMCIGPRQTIGSGAAQRGPQHGIVGIDNRELGHQFLCFAPCVGDARQSDFGRFCQVNCSESAKSITLVDQAAAT